MSDSLLAASIAYFQHTALSYPSPFVYPCHQRHLTQEHNLMCISHTSASLRREWEMSCQFLADHIKWYAAAFSSKPHPWTHSQFPINVLCPRDHLAGFWTYYFSIHGFSSLGSVVYGFDNISLFATGTLLLKKFAIISSVFIIDHNY